ncbi:MULTISPECIES: PLP-dependent cysteine synthase family protein [unclassified Carboxylicivirga]|uniref:PLP-dependent cysteine synthase family protein n=1 Tax=Carboxylicivirga TaxID=1628153 RepID=UPI003D3458C2
MNDHLFKRMQGLSTLIGNTPLLAIEFEYKGTKRKIYAKAEFLNLTGSIKDRMAFHILNKAYESGELKDGDRIIEATSGNTGIAFSGLGRAMGHPVTIFMPNWMSQERKNLIKSFGANIRLVTPEEGGFLGSIEMANQLATESNNTFLPRQFSNFDNCEAHYNTTGPELYWQLRFRGLTPDAFVAGVGTGGTVMGVGKFLREQIPGIKIHPLEPSNSPTMTTGYKVGKHRIQGISDEFIPTIVKLDQLDEIISVDDGDAIMMAQKLSTALGLGVGISSGANFIGALKIQEELGPDAVVVTVFADDNKKYLSTDLVREEPVKADFLSTGVSLLSYAAYKRVCHTCCDPNECLEGCHSESAPTPVLPSCPRREAVL